MPACVCPPGFMGSRCEHADLLAVVAADQKQQTIASVLVGGVVGSVLLILLCVLLHVRRGMDFITACSVPEPEHSPGMTS
ncbi:UNVERIFIED_CONTAM: hypothetical protein FKN15_059340 [Acipenser sinensis]